MAITYSIAPNPHWVVIDNFSKLPPGAAIYTYSHLNPSEFKPAFQDAAGTIPWTQPIVGFQNGTFPPIYWATDSDNPDDSYYIRVYDAVQGFPNNGRFLWDFDGLTGGGAGGGGGGSTTVNDIENFVVNSEFYWHADNQAGATFITLAPSSHASIGGYANNAIDGPPSPDIIFAKGNSSATDSISFNLFSPIGTNDLSPNPTPQLYLNYTCAIAGSSENYKYIQFPLVKGLQNTSGQTTSLKIFARSVNNSTGVQLYYRQFFGNGASVMPSADVDTPLGGSFLALTPSWQAFDMPSQVVPSIAGKSLGDCGNDALYLQIRMPLDSLVNVDIALPACYLGTNVSTLLFDTLDQVSTLIDTPRTGDIRYSINTFSPYGWVPMNDGTIGNPSSGSTTRANQDTFQLFDLIWRTFLSSQTLAPMFTSGNTPIAYGASSVEDFSNNRRLSLTKTAGRLLAAIGLPSSPNSVPVTGGSNTGTTWAIGQTTGNELHTQSVAEIAAHNHGVPGGQIITTGAGSNNYGTGAFTTNIQATTLNTGSGTAFNVQQPTTYLNVFIKL